jgi:hypothetical protein
VKQPVGESGELWNRARYRTCRDSADVVDDGDSHAESGVMHEQRPAGCLDRTLPGHVGGCQCALELLAVRSAARCHDQTLVREVGKAKRALLRQAVSARHDGRHANGSQPNGGEVVGCGG